jgi:hypothetical protein
LEIKLNDIIFTEYEGEMLIGIPSRLSDKDEAGILNLEDSLESLEFEEIFIENNNVIVDNETGDVSLKEKNDQT